MADGGDGDASSADVPPAPRCEATAPRCQDEQASGLRLFNTVNPAGVTEETAPAGEFLSHVDASAGGMTPRQSYVYLRFTPTGLEKLALSDEEAFGSLDWDIAVRRFVLRLNSGVAGPGCVEAARMTPGTDFAAVTEAPAAERFATEAYFDEGCRIVEDGTGIGSPRTVLSDFWNYGMCVAMSNYVYVLRLRDGRLVKLQVRSYYDPPAQEQCDTVGTAPSPNGAGNLRLRWAFLP